MDITQEIYDHTKEKTKENEIRLKRVFDTTQTKFREDSSRVKELFHNDITVPLGEQPKRSDD